MKLVSPSTRGVKAAVPESDATPSCPRYYLLISEPLMCAMTVISLRGCLEAEIGFRSAPVGRHFDAGVACMFYSTFVQFQSNCVGVFVQRRVCSSGSINASVK